MTKTMLDLLRTQGEKISEEGSRLLREFSRMHPVNRPGDSCVLISGSGDQFWDTLAPSGKRIQVSLLPEVDRFTGLVSVLTQNLPSGTKRNLLGSLKTIRSSIEQDDQTWWKTPEEAANGFRSLVGNIIDSIDDFFDSSSGETFAIADTNALIGNPDIEHWQFENVESFTLILTPTILSELEKHKINHQNPDVRGKATSIIRKIKEYRRRGPLHNGVIVVRDKVKLQSIANEPNMSQSFSWFDATNADDHFLASAIEIMCAEPGRKIFIVTADINLQNKAEMACVPFREVPSASSSQEES